MGVVDVLLPQPQNRKYKSLAKGSGNYLKDVPLLDIDVGSDQDIIIAVVGAPGSGKSSFIQLATGLSDVIVGHTLGSCTQKIQAFSVPHPMDSKRNVVFVDTPGFEDTHGGDTVVLQGIADWLKKTYERGMTLTGLLFLHRIADDMLAGAPLRNLAMYKKLCGVNALQSVALVTTMWDEIDETTTSCHEELRTKHWNPMVDVGSQIFRFGHTRESAWAIVDQLNNFTLPTPVQRVPRIIDNGHHSGKLVATVSALRHARHIAHGIPFVPLKGAVDLALTIAESVEGMRRNDHALHGLAQTVNRFVASIAANVQNENVPEDIKHIVDDLIAELNAINRIIKRRSFQRGRASSYLHQAGDANLIAACSERFNNACHQFEIHCAIRTRQAIDRLGATIAARPNHSPPSRCCSCDSNCND